MSSQGVENIGNPDVQDFYKLVKTNGAAVYGSDLRMSGMLYCRFLRSPYPHATIKSIDTSQVERMSGVSAIITGKDVATMPLISGPRLPSRFILAVDRVRYAGEEVAAVAAKDEMTAVDACEAIKVDYEPLPWATEMQDALSPDAYPIQPGGNFVAFPPITRGDITTGFAQASKTVEGTLRFSGGNMQHSEMNPRACVAFWNYNKLTVIEDTQWAHATQRGLASWFNIPLDWVQVKSAMTGGAFGNKGGPVQNNMAAALLSRMTGSPVLAWLTREDQFLNTTNKYNVITRAKMGATSDGKLTAMHVIQYGDGGAYGIGSVANSLLTFRNSYVCPNGLFEGGSVYTNKPSSGAYRDVGSSQGTHACETFIDMLAEEVGMDPAQFRLENLVTGASPYSQDTVTPAQAGGGNNGKVVAGKTPYTSMPQPTALQNVLRAVGWNQKWVGWGKPTAVDGSKYRGIGVAVYTCDKGGIAPYSGGWVKVSPDGTITLYSGIPEIGCGQHTTMRVIVGQVLGVDISHVNAVYGDTDVTPDSFIVAGSLGTHSAGLAIYRAAMNARQQLLQAASTKLNVPVSGLDTKNGSVFVVSDPSQSVSFAALTNGQTIQGIGDFVTARDILPKWPNGFLAIQRGAAAAEVEVDVESGIVKVINYAASHGVGRVIFSQGANNQFQGGAINAMGYAIQMEPVIDPLTGRTLNPNFHDFRQPTIKDMVELENPQNMQMVWVEQNDPTGPFGAVGLGEPMAVPVAAAVVNAVYNAIGIRINRTPLTPDRVIDALKQGKSYDGVGWKVPSPTELGGAVGPGGITD